MSSFDVESVIAEFISDSQRTSIELPHMTTGQRKHVKKLLAELPDISCESFGFGPDRKLHLFKAKKIEANSKVLDPQQESVAAETQRVGANDGDVHHSEAGNACQGLLSADRTKSGSSMLRFELPSALEGIQVRNTFIEVKDTSSDARAVQSMPHGMFGRLLEDELSTDDDSNNSELPQPSEALFLNTMNEDLYVGGFGSLAQAAYVSKLPPRAPEAIPALLYAQAPSELTSTSPQPPPPVHLAAGTEVVVDGLMKLPAFNGLRGTVVSLDETSGRYNVLLNSPSAPGGSQPAKVKGENLRVVEQCSPSSFPQSWEPEHSCSYAAAKPNATLLQLTAMV
eukprot:TRINITY_DN27295_c0_g1_i1.p1 TRINITY_DN27295_c0_g1~~TRINITY_DN27295_c0_g1_i1.p1  ORF type:complete len:339 (-),score=57.97 TRINITY_DN27295_c0_g1_i1:198-1214(-)